jgi:hypothetical protein
MAAVPFDTLKLARRLESAGFPAQQAGDTADALAEALSEFATKADIVKPRANTPGSKVLLFGMRFLIVVH